MSDRNQNIMLTPNKEMNVLIYHSLCASMRAGDGWKTVDAKRVQWIIFVQYYFTGLLQRIFNRDKIRDTSLTPDDVLNISLDGKMVKLQYGPLFWLLRAQH